MAILTEVGSLTLNAGENIGASCVLDTVNNNLYVACSTSNVKLVKIAADALTRTGVITLSGPGQNDASEIDSANQIAYIGSGVAPNAATVHKISLATFQEIASGDLIGVNPLGSDIDLQNGLLYIGSNDTIDPDPAKWGGRFSAIATSTFSISKQFTNTTGVSTSIKSISGDFLNGLLYAAVSAGTDHLIWKVDSSTLEKISSIAADGATNAIVVDPINGMLYTANGGSQLITKINLNNFTLIDTVLLGNGSDIGKNCMVIDTCLNYLYVKAVGTPAWIYSIDLSTFEINWNLQLSSGGNSTAQGLAIDATRRFLYTSGSETPAKVLKIALLACPAEAEPVIAVTAGAEAEEEGSIKRKREKKLMPITRHRKGILWRY